MATLSVEERLALIRENLAEILNPEIIEGAMNEGRNPKIYFGTPLLSPWSTGFLLTMFKELRRRDDLTADTSCRP
jgi:tyrosyl-tRNA synthetase